MGHFNGIYKTKLLLDYNPRVGFDLNAHPKRGNSLSQVHGQLDVGVQGGLKPRDPSAALADFPYPENTRSVMPYARGVGAVSLQFGNQAMVWAAAKLETPMCARKTPVVPESYPSDIKALADALAPSVTSSIGVPVNAQLVVGATLGPCFAYVEAGQKMMSLNEKSPWLQIDHGEFYNAQNLPSSVTQDGLSRRYIGGGVGGTYSSNPRDPIALTLTADFTLRQYKSQVELRSSKSVLLPLTTQTGASATQPDVYVENAIANIKLRDQQKFWGIHTSIDFKVGNKKRFGFGGQLHVENALKRSNGDRDYPQENGKAHKDVILLYQEFTATNVNGQQYYKKDFDEYKQNYSKSYHSMAGTVQNYNIYANYRMNKVLDKPINVYVKYNHQIPWNGALLYDPALTSVQIGIQALF